MLEGIFVCKKENVTWGRRKLYNEKFHNFCSQ